MELRKYQKEAQAAIVAAWARGVRRTLLVLPTGCGKTIVFCKLCEQLVAQGKRVLILAHRGELLDQAADKMKVSTGLGCAVEKAERSCLEGDSQWYRIVVGSVQTMSRKKRLERFDSKFFDAIIVDEAHHVLAGSYQRILGYFDNSKVLGVTATPDRGDSQNLGEFFECVAYEYTLPKAIIQGFLAPISALTIPLKIDLSKVKTQAGDFKSSDIGCALGPYLEDIATEMVKHCRGRKTVVFLPLISTSKKMKAILERRGLNVAELNGQTKERGEILQDFQDGRYDVLCNSMLLTEGWDCPDVDCIVCLRPTKVRSLYAQIVGRGTRIAPGKKDLLLLDFLWNSERHDLCRPAHLIAESEKVAKKMIEISEKTPGKAASLEEAMEEAKDRVAEIEQKLAQQLASFKSRKQKLIDPLQFELAIADQDLKNYVPSFGWEMAPASDKQKTALMNAGIQADRIESAGMASAILTRLGKRRAAGLSTPKQIRLLERYGFEQVGQWPIAAASEMIDRISINGWRIPTDIVPSEYRPEKRKEENQEHANRTTRSA